jgi:hypothetical protein
MWSALLVGSLLAGPAGDNRGPITPRFSDVPADHWAAPAVEELRRLGILRGYPPDPAGKQRAPAGPWPAAR